MKLTASAMALAFALSSGHAFAAACSVVGTWTDNYGVTATFTTNKLGTATAPSFCTATYKIVVTTLTAKVFNSKATVKQAGCPTPVTAKLAFAKGSCTSASGTISAPGFPTLSDTWTKTGAIKVRPTQSTLLDGFRH